MRKKERQSNYTRWKQLRKDKREQVLYCTYPIHIVLLAGMLLLVLLVGISTRLTYHTIREKNAKIAKLSVRNVVDKMHDVVKESTSRIDQALLVTLWESNAADSQVKSREELIQKIQNYLEATNQGEFAETLKTPIPIEIYGMIGEQYVGKKQKEQSQSPDLTEYEWFQKAIDHMGGFVYVTPEINAVDFDNIITVAKAVQSNAGRIVYAIDFSFEEIDQYLQRITQERYYKSFVVNEEGLAKYKNKKSNVFYENIFNEWYLVYQVENRVLCADIWKIMIGIFLMLVGFLWILYFTLWMTWKNRERSTKDELTGLYNRWAILEFIEKRVRRKKKFAVIFIDLDNFKSINDYFGHAGGDAVLCKVARDVKNISHRGEVFARIGGDEFVGVIEYKRNRQEVLEFCETFMQEFAKPLELQEEILQSTCSVGIAFYPEDGLTEKDLLNAADQKMYQAKRDGKSHYCYK